MIGRTAKSWALLLFFLIPLAAQAQVAELIPQAKALMAKQKWADAAPLVTKALAEPGNDYESFLTLLEMKGVIAAMTSTRKEDLRAEYKDAFGKMLSLDPDRRLKGKWPRKAQLAFAEVQRKPPAPLEIETSTATQANGKIQEVAIGLKGDPLHLAKTVVFNWRTVGAKWKTKPVPATTGRVAAKVDGGKIEWYATVLGENDAELGHLASSEIPMVDKAIGAVADPVPADDDFGKKKKSDAEAAKLTPQEKTETPATEVVIEKPSNTTWKSTAGYVAAGLGIVGIGVGSVFGVMSNGARSSFTTGIGKTDANGFVTGISRSQALQYQSTAQNDALLANLMWGIGGGLLLVGIALKVLDILGGS